MLLHQCMYTYFAVYRFSPSRTLLWNSTVILGCIYTFCSGFSFSRLERPHNDCGTQLFIKLLRKRPHLRSRPHRSLLRPFSFLIYKGTHFFVCLFLFTDHPSSSSTLLQPHRTHAASRTFVRVYLGMCICMCLSFFCLWRFSIPTHRHPHRFLPRIPVCLSVYLSVPPFLFFFLPLLLSFVFLTRV